MYLVLSCQDLLKEEKDHEQTVSHGSWGYIEITLSQILKKKVAQAENILQELLREIVPAILWKPERSRWRQLLQHAPKIEQILDRYTDMWRFPAYLTHDSILYTITSEQQKWVFLCIMIYLVYLVPRHTDIAYKKYGWKALAVAHILFPHTYSLQEARTERDIEIQTTWSRKYDDTIRKVLGDDLFIGRFASLLKHERPKWWHDGSEVRKTRLSQAWEEERRCEALWCVNPISERNPARDIPHINFLFCQTHNPYIQNQILPWTLKDSRHHPWFSAWIEQYGHLLVDPTTETHAAFLRMFHLYSPVTLFDHHGKISRECAQKRELRPYCRALEAVAQKNNLPQSRRWVSVVKTQETVAGRIRDIEVSPVPAIVQAKFDHTSWELSFVPPLNESITSVRIRIQNERWKTKALGKRLIRTSGERLSINIYQDHAAFFECLNGDSLPLGKWMPAFKVWMNYSISVTPYVWEISWTEYAMTQRFLFPRERKEALVTPRSAPPSSSLSSAEKQGNWSSPASLSEKKEEPRELSREERIEREEEEINLALELFWEQDEDILRSYFEKAVSKEEKMMCFIVTIKDLQACGYVQKELDDTSLLAKRTYIYSQRRCRPQSGSAHLPGKALKIFQAWKQEKETRETEEKSQDGQGLATAKLQIQDFEKVMTETWIEPCELPLSWLRQELDPNRLTGKDLIPVIDWVRPSLRRAGYTLWFQTDVQRGSGVTSLTLRRIDEKHSWAIILYLKPEISAEGQGIWQDELASPVYQEFLRALMGFLYLCPKVGDKKHIKDHATREEREAGRRRWRQRMESNPTATATIAILGHTGHPIFIHDVRWQDLDGKIRELSQQHGARNVGIVHHRCATIRCHTEGRVGVPGQETLEHTYAEILSETVEWKERRGIIWERVLATFFHVNFVDHHHAGFSRTSPAYEVLIRLRQERFGGIPQEEHKQLIDNTFITEFVIRMQTAGVRLSYQRPFIDSYWPWAFDPENQHWEK